MKITDKQIEPIAGPVLADIENDIRDMGIDSYLTDEQFDGMVERIEVRLYALAKAAIQAERAGRQAAEQERDRVLWILAEAMAYARKEGNEARAAEILGVDQLTWLEGCLAGMDVEPALMPAVRAAHACLDGFLDGPRGLGVLQQARRILASMLPSDEAHDVANERLNPPK